MLIILGEKIDAASAGGRMVLNLLSSVLQWGREIAAEGTSAAMQHLRSMNRLVCAALYGWRCEVGQDGKKRLVHEPDEQLMLAGVRRFRDARLSLRKVALELKRRDMLSRNGKRFDPAQIATMVRAAAR